MHLALKILYFNVLDKADGVDVVQDTDPNFPTQP